MLTNALNRRNAATNSHSFHAVTRACVCVCVCVLPCVQRTETFYRNDVIVSPVRDVQGTFFAAETIMTVRRCVMRPSS